MKPLHGLRLLAALLVGAPPALAQSDAAARAVLLRIAPRAGDVINTRVEQSVDIVVNARSEGADASLTSRITVATLLLLRNFVQSSDGSGTTLVVSIDSVAISGTNVKLPTEPERRALQGKQMRTRITGQGSMSVLDAPSELPSEVQTVLSNMPAQLPSHPVSLGQTWKQSAMIPIGDQPGGGGTGTLHATYRLDSLSRDGRLAHVSMKGTLVRDTAAASDARPAIRVDGTGSVSGALVFDRARGWITDSWTVIVLRSTRSFLGARANRSEHYQIRLTQRMRSKD
jgi:hypothetical protein